VCLASSQPAYSQTAGQQNEHKGYADEDKSLNSLRADR